MLCFSCGWCLCVCVFVYVYTYVLVSWIDWQSSKRREFISLFKCFLFLYLKKKKIIIKASDILNIQLMGLKNGKTIVTYINVCWTENVNKILYLVPHLDTKTCFLSLSLRVCFSFDLSSVFVCYHNFFNCLFFSSTIINFYVLI